MSAQTPNDAQNNTITHIHHKNLAGLKVSRDIPMPWLIGIVATLFMQAALMYYQLNALVDAQAKTTAEIKELRATLNTKDLKDLEHDLKITDLQRQYADLQNRTASTEIRLQGLKK